MIGRRAELVRRYAHVVKQLCTVCVFIRVFRTLLDYRFLALACSRNTCARAWLALWVLWTRYKPPQDAFRPCITSDPYAAARSVFRLGSYEGTQQRIPDPIIQRREHRQPLGMATILKACNSTNVWLNSVFRPES